MDEWQKGKFGKPLIVSQPQQKLNDVRKFCFEHLPKTMQLMSELVHDKLAEPSVRGSLLKFMAEQACGKAPKSMEVKDVDNIPASMMSNEQLRLLAAGKMKELIFSAIQSGQIEELIREYREMTGAENTEISTAPGENIKQLESSV